MDDGFVQFFGGMDLIILGTDDNETTLNDSVDISDVGLRDDFDRFIFGLLFFGLSNYFGNQRAKR